MKIKYIVNADKKLTIAKETDTGKCEVDGTDPFLIAALVNSNVNTLSYKKLASMPHMSRRQVRMLLEISSLLSIIAVIMRSSSWLSRL